MANTSFLSDPLRPSRLPEDGNAADTLDWMEAASNEAKAFLTAQRGYERIQRTMDRILSPDEPLRPEKMSRTASNETGKIATVLASLMSDVRPFWDYRTFNPQYQQQAEISNRLAETWYRSRTIDQKNSAVAKYALAAGSGYGHLVWNRDIQDIDLIPEDPRDVLPIRPSSISSSLQESMGVIIKREMPVSRIEAMWPHVEGKIRPDRDGAAPSMFDRTTRVGKILSKLNMSPVEIWRTFRAGAEKRADGGRYPVADLSTCYLSDTTIHKGSSPIEVGQFRTDPATGRRTALNNWSYICQPGEQIYRTGKRLIIATSSCVIYDGPSWYWMPLFPVFKLTPDPWPWSFLGKSPMWDLEPLQDSLDKISRYIDDKIAVMARPPVTGDKNSVSENEMRKFDPAQPGQKLRHAAIGAGIKIEQIQPIDPAAIQQREWILQRMYHLSGVQDLTQLLRLNQMPSDNTIETLLAAMSPDLRGRSRAIEAYMTELSQALLYNFAQFYTLPRRLAILGPSGQTIDDWDFDPDSFIPAFMPSDYDSEGRVRQDILNSPRPRYDRTRELVRQLNFYVKPGSLLESASTTEKMLAIQLARMGYLDMWSLHERLGTPNLGEVPQGSIMDRLQKQAEMLQGMQVGPAGASAAGRKAAGASSPQMTSNGSISESDQ